jgi:hypothetical protein
MLEDYKSESVNSMTRMEETVRTGEENVAKIVKEVDERALRTMNSVNEAKDSVSAIKSQSDFDFDQIRFNAKNTSDSVYTLTKRLEALEHFVQPMMENDILPMVQRQGMLRVGVKI